MLKDWWNYIFGEKNECLFDFSGLKVDMHSHLLPSLDDGVNDLEEAVSTICELKSLGFQKLITTPHIMQEGFPNTPASINSKTKELKKELQEREVHITFEAGAEYYLDDFFQEKVNHDEPLLTIGEKGVLIEFPYMNKPFNSEQVIFELQSKGYQPILAHPERYLYLFGDGTLDKFNALRSRGVWLQVNISSLVRGHSKTAQLARLLAKEGMIDLLGTDLHRITQIEYLKKGLENQYIVDLIKNDQLLNSKLL